MLDVVALANCPPKAVIITGLGKGPMATAKVKLAMMIGLRTRGGFVDSRCRNVVKPSADLLADNGLF